MRRLAKFVLVGIAGLAVLFLLLLTAGLIVIQTPWFHEKVRERIVYEIEKATGGRCELGSFSFDWRTLTAEVSNLAIHGTEGPGEAPLFRADSVRVGLKIVSILQKKVDLESVVVRRPRVNLIVYEDGRTNLPQPKVPREPGRNTLDVLLDLAVRRFQLVDGLVQAQMRQIPLNLLGENLRAQVLYEAAPARYRGEIAFRSPDVPAGSGKPLPVDVDATLVLERHRLSIEAVRLAANGSTVDVKGAVDFASPVANLEYTANIDLKRLPPGLNNLGPVRPLGTVSLAGRATLSGPSDYSVTGKLRAGGLAVRERGIAVENIRVDSNVAITPDRIDLRDLRLFALHGRFDGRAELVNFRDFRVEGAVCGFALHEATRVEGIQRMIWTGNVSGPVRLSGRILRGNVGAFQLNTQLVITRAPGENPVQGLIDLAYDQTSGNLTFGPSNIVTNFSRLTFSGVLGRQMNAAVETTNLDDAQPAIAMFSAGPPPAMPVKLLDHGSAKFHGVVSGPLENPTIEGHAVMTSFTATGRQFDRAEADVVVSQSGASAQNAVVTRLGVRAAGSVHVGFRKWNPGPDEPISGSFSVRSPNLRDALAAADLQSPVEATAGGVTADVTLAGTIGAPQVNARAQATKVVLYGQPIDRVQGEVRHTEDQLEIPTATLVNGASHVQISGRFDHPKDNWSRGRVRFQVASGGINLAQLKAVQELVPDVQGLVETQLAGEISLGRRGFRPGAFNGRVAVRGLGFKGEALGSVLLTAATKGTDLGITLEGDVAGAKLTGTSNVTLRGDYPAHGRVEFTPLRFSTLLAHLRRTPASADLPFNGTVAGTLDFSGNTTDPQSWKGTLELPAIEIQPAPGIVDLPNTSALALRNTGPVLVDVDLNGARVRQAHFRAKDTNLNVTGRIGLGIRNPWDLRVQGNANLALLHEFENQLLSSGSVVLDVSVRGALEKPDIYGRIDLRNASVNLAGFPNGIDNANGVIFLYRDRAMIETLTAGTGGGTVSVSGFVSFAGETTFHLQAKASDVRLRYPEGVSSTSNATLAFTGTMDRSVLSGDVTITRVGFNPRSDLGTILANASQPVEVPAQPSRFRQGLRFDVRVATAPEVRFETKLTRDIQADARLRLRGDGTHPIVLGSVTISQGEVLFFGNRYTINTGQILFVNASKIEPTVNLDLETRARGVNVTLHVSGPVNKLNVSYRSDPPLPFSDIVALLTTGREPNMLPGTTNSQSQVGQAQSWQQAGASALVSQAIASPIAGRLERFFGVSRLKIDPQVTGLTTNNAAARFTVEQNISNNLTFTYITDLSRSQAQTIRIEWGFTNNWSGVAVREENGLFGVDFLYRKQVK
jgi:translocation and assembly module TamB